ncbi:cation diffusion facilitator family transporter [Afifella sp. JA880]|uniref:cation diffusion facilitator family transporter n=1 Tax=Afifella sp. JA880 TaxID=2975280 RepID=UPI0021BB6651|nr:cation diffusion facilitator family transporter [Afifella sp. JA880]MCT8268223.1 cation diffusion facilitator family transporter [Afifella sp. JA880]
MAIAAALTGSFMLAEAIGGFLSGSLALLADAGHMLTDFASLSLAWFAFRIARRPADWKRTYGFDRFQVLIAFVNGIALLAICVWIIVEAVRRFNAPVEVMGTPMLVIAVLGLIINIAVFFVLHSSEEQNLNMRGAILHVLGDLLGSVAAIIAALVILTTGWMPIDPILSLLVCLLILRSAWYVTSQSGHILLEGAPAGVDVREIERDLPQSVEGVLNVHHVHAWAISEERPMVTLHARLADGVATDITVRAIKARIAERFDIDHATIEVEGLHCADEAMKRAS